MSDENRVSNSQDVIDSRDVIERIKELEEIIEDGSPTHAEKEELEDLKKLQEEAEGSPDWEYGETLVRDSYFEDYAEELARDTGSVDEDAKWPMNHIDWEAAADELKQDYFSVDFGGVDYWIRS